MSTKTRIVLLNCGSFNPITNMHLRMFELARDYLHRTGRFQVIGGIVSPVNDAYQKQDLISAKHRCQMVDLALRSSDWIRLDCWESDQNSWMRTVKVLAHHQNCLDSITNANDQPDAVPKKQKLEYDNMNYSFSGNGTYNNWDLSQSAKLMLLCGADFLQSFDKRDIWDETDVVQIVDKYGLCVITRQGTDALKFIYESDILTRLQNNIHVITEWITNGISSTHIRRALRRRESIRYLVPESVVQYIKDHCLYQSNKS